MIRYLADVATPLYAAVHKIPFQWMTTEQGAYVVVVYFVHYVKK